jgi:hypothetical protein
MFDLRANDGSVRREEFQSPIPAGEEPKRDKTGNALDSNKSMAIHSRLMDHYTRELDRQFLNRAEQAIDADFYDNDQWREEDKAILEERGQVPIVYNVIASSVDWVIGSEKQSRTDYKVLPRRKDGSKPAEKKKQLLKYLSDVNRTPFHVSRSFEDCVKVGVGWIEDGIQKDGENEPLYCRYESWRNILHDSSSTELDLSDARYVFRSKWVDVDIAMSMFPKRRALIENSVDSAYEHKIFDIHGDDAMDSQEIALDETQRTRRSEDPWGGYTRERVRLIEAWFKIPIQVQMISGGQFSGEIYDPNSRGHNEAIDSGESFVRPQVKMRMHVAIMTTSGLLFLGRSPYRHNKYPFTPIWGYRRDRDQLPYGMIRRLRDIQEDINKRASKALAILSQNKVIMEKGAVDDVDEFADEIARPDAIIEVNTGKSIDLNTDRELSQWHLELMGRNIAMIQQSSGVTDELMGRQTNATSGKAIERRQSQGAMATTKFFDNLRFAKQLSGEKQCANIEQFMTEKKQFRITNMRGIPDFIDINDELPENDVTRSKADYVISEEDWRASVRQAQADALFELVAKLAPVAPGAVMVILDLVVESMDIPNVEEIVNRIRAVTGQRDPDAEEPTPEEIARAAKAQEAEQMQSAAAAADLREKVAKAAKTEAEAAVAGAKVPGTNVESLTKALEAARSAIEVPASAHIADHILSESGYKSQSDKEAEMAAAMAAAQEQQQAQQPPQPEPEQANAPQGVPGVSADPSQPAPA